MKKPKERPDGIFPKCGIVRSSGHGDGAIRIENHPDKLNGEFVETFDSIDALLRAGWIVD